MKSQFLPSVFIRLSGSEWQGTLDRFGVCLPKKGANIYR